MFLSAISNLFGVGASSVISRALGRDNPDRAKLASDFATWGCLSVSTVYCVGVLALMNPFVNALGGSHPLVHQNAVDYMLVAVVLGGLPTAISTMLSHIIRSLGYSAHASAGIIIGGVVNIGLDPLFMFVLLPKGHEAQGAAIATALSNLAALIYYIIILQLKRKKFAISVKPVRKMFGDGIPHDVFIVSIPACLMTLCENVSYAVLDNLMSASGTAAQAGIGVAKKINMFAHCFVRGMSQGVLPLIGYNYASGNRQRMKAVIYTSLSISLGISLLCTLCFTLFSKPLVGLFIRTVSDSLEYGSRFLKILCVGAPFSSFAYTVISFFQATGRGGKSLILALMRKGILDIPMMFALNVLMPTYGVVAATPATDIICSVTAVVLFCIFIRKHGKNKEYYEKRLQAKDG